MSKIKIFQGSRSSNAPRLCDTCSFGVVARGAQDSQELVFCHSMERTITMRVVECSQYYDRTQTRLEEFQKIAWILSADPRRQKIGFLTPGEAAREPEPALALNQ